MNKASLKKLSKSKLIKLLLNQKKRKPEIIIADDTKPVPTQRTYKPRPPVPTPRKSVKHMAKEYEENIILPPPKFRDNYKPVTTQRPRQPPNLLGEVPEINVPILKPTVVTTTQ